jgi:hypothetical protein
MTIGLHFVLEEITTECGLDAERREKTGRHLRGECVLRLAVCGQREGITAVGGEGLDSLRRAFPIQIIRIRGLGTVRTVIILNP